MDVSQALGSAGDSNFSRGIVVTMSGLKNVFFNGMTGIIVSDSAKDGRVCVQLALPPRQTISVKTENLHVAPSDSAASLVEKASKKNADSECERAASVALKKEFRMTDAQRHAAELIAVVADSATAFISNKGSQPTVDNMNLTRYGKECLGESMEMLLGSTTLIDAQYLLALGKAGGVLPRWQEIPDAARIDGRNVWRLRFWDNMQELPVLVWSYCWYSKFHPDPKGEQLQRVLPILEIMVEEAKKFGEHCTIGVLQDYGSFPQWPRSPEEKARFDKGLKGELNSWYSHPNTVVLMLDIPASSDPEHTNRRLYSERGWCFTEERLATAVKYSFAFWKLSLFDGTCTTYGALRLQMVAKRPAPVAPTDFGVTMRSSVEAGKLSFTAEADMDFVIELYRKGFTKAFENISSGGQWNYSATDIGDAKWWALGWGDEQIHDITVAIDYVKRHCALASGHLTVNLQGNEFTDEGKMELQELGDDEFEILIDRRNDRWWTRGCHCVLPGIQEESRISMDSFDIYSRFPSNRDERDSIEEKPPESSARAAKAGSEFTVILSKTDDCRRLGMAVDTSNSKCLIVESVVEGLLQLWNEERASNPDSQVVPGDMIIGVNGVSGDAMKMAEACGTYDVLEFTVQRPPLAQLP